MHIARRGAAPAATVSPATRRPPCLRRLLQRWAADLQSQRLLQGALPRETVVFPDAGECSKGAATDDGVCSESGTATGGVAAGCRLLLRVFSSVAICNCSRWVYVDQGIGRLSLRASYGARPGGSIGSILRRTLSAPLKILQLIDEPIAAALSSTTVKKGTIVVFDMGAGSYNVSILGVSGPNIEITSQFGDPFVGGDQFDDILVDYFVSQISKLYLFDIRGDKYAMMLLAELVEQAKVELSSQHKVTVSLPCIISSAQCPGYPNISISREEFENLGVNLVQQIQDKCQTLLEEANISSEDIDEVILTGGMTRVPMIQKIIGEVFGKHQITRVNQEEAVVIGSAIQAALIVEDQRERSEDVMPLSIGIESEGIFVRIIPRHATIPMKRTVKIPAWCAYGECVPLKVFLGEHVIVHHNVFLGEIKLINNQGSCQGSVYFELTFEVDKDFVVKVSGRNVDNQLRTEYDVEKALKVFPVREIVMCKHKVDKAVQTALLDWKMHGTEVNARLIHLARYIVNTLSDVLSAREDEVPKDVCDNAAKALADLLKAMDGDAHVLKDKMLAAELAKELLLNWKPPSEFSNGAYSDYED